MKSKCCNKPLRLSRENPEPGETMYYICDGCNQPADPKCDHSDENELTGEQLHADDYVDKNYPDEREVSKLKEASMQNKPRIDFDAHRFDIILSVDAGLKRIFDERLATALEDQRATFVDEVKNRKATIKWLWGKQKTDDECFLMVMEQVQKIADILNGKE